MASLWRALHVWRGLHQHASSCPAGASLRFAHCAPFPYSRAHLPGTRGWAGQLCAAATDSSDIELWKDEYKEQVGEDGAVVLPLQSDGAPLWFGKLPSIDDVRTVKDWPQHVRDWRQFWAAVKVWRRCLSCRDVYNLHQLPSTAELAWLRLLDSKGRLREVDICLVRAQRAWAQRQAPLLWRRLGHTVCPSAHRHVQAPLLSLQLGHAVCCFGS